jgi:bacterial/archaeal transporter family protein
MGWIQFAILATISFGFYNFFTKLSADKLSPPVAFAIMAATALIVALIGIAFYKIAGMELVFTKEKLIFPVLAGVSTGLAEIFYLSMFAKDAPLAIGNPFVVGGTIIVAIVLGLLILKEPIGLYKGIGILVTLIGIVILSKG